MEVTKNTFQVHSQNVQQSNKTKSNNTFSEIFASYQSINPIAGAKEIDSDTVFSMNTNKGNTEKINLDEYLTPGPRSSSVNLDDVSLLLPSAHNIEVLSKYSQEEFKKLLVQYDIPSSPETIEFDNHGKLVLPDDYAYSEKLEQAFSENPKVENALRTTAALASHYAGIMEGQPFRDEMSTARSQADRNRIIEKYSYLFDDNRAGKQIILSFLDDGNMLVGEKKSKTMSA